MAVEVWSEPVLTVVCRCGDYDLPAQAVHANAVRRELDGALMAVCPECGDNCPIPAPTGRVGWWWWSCFPGCLPDSEAQGPFDTEREATIDAIGYEES